VSWLEDVSASSGRRQPLCHFRKHRGKEWTKIVREDPGYVEWLVSHDGPEIDGELYDYLIDLLEGE
jgi:hypothetical protein